MTVDPTTFKAKLYELYGHGCKTRMAEHLGLHPKTVHRWGCTSTPVPVYADKLVDAMLEIKRLKYLEVARAKILLADAKHLEAFERRALSRVHS